MFDFVKVDFKEIEVEPVNDNGVRYYKIPDTDKYFPSVTSITSFQNAQFFKKWRTKIGEDEANRITARATQRGTTFHSITEDYINGKLNIDQYMDNNPLCSSYVSISKVYTKPYLKHTLFRDFLILSLSRTGRTTC